MFIGWSSTKFMFFCSDIKWKIAATAELRLTLDTKGKVRNFVEDLPMILPGKFGFNYPSGFREEAF
jgi:hypothetical protein